MPAMGILSVIMTPPADGSRDGEMVRYFLSLPGKKIVCGGATARMVGAFLGEETDLDLSSYQGEFPPPGSLPGIDLVTEGRITLARVADAMSVPGGKAVPAPDPNGAAGMMIRMLQEAEEVYILFGSAVCPPGERRRKAEILERLIILLRKAEKRVTVTTY